MKKYIKLIALALVAVMTFSLAACSEGGAADTTEKLLTFSNSTEFYILGVGFAPTEDLFGTDSEIMIIDEEALNPGKAREITVSFPNDEYKGSWVIYVLAVNTNNQKTYESVIDLGEVFNDDPDLFLDDVYGFEFVYDAENDEIDVVNLDGTRI